MRAVRRHAFPAFSSMLGYFSTRSNQPEPAYLKSLDKLWDELKNIEGLHAYSPKHLSNCLNTVRKLHLLALEPQFVPTSIDYAPYERVKPAGHFTAGSRYEYNHASCLWPQPHPYANIAVNARNTWTKNRKQPNNAATPDSHVFFFFFFFRFSLGMLSSHNLYICHSYFWILRCRWLPSLSRKHGERLSKYYSYLILIWIDSFDTLRIANLDHKSK